MLAFDPHSEARERARQLQAQAAAERLYASTTRRLLAGALRRTADRLDSRPLVIPLNCSHR
jgi:hypothetical protein